MICNHGHDKAVVDAMVSEVRKLLHLNEDQGEVALIDNVIYVLESEFKAGITSIHAGMSVVMSARTFDQSFETIVECDSIYEGFAAIYKAFYDHKQQGSERPVANPRSGMQELRSEATIS